MWHPPGPLVPAAELPASLRGVGDSHTTECQPWSVYSINFDYARVDASPAYQPYARNPTIPAMRRTWPARTIKAPHGVIALVG